MFQLQSPSPSRYVFRTGANNIENYSSDIESLRSGYYTVLHYISIFDFLPWYKNLLCRVKMISEVSFATLKFPEMTSMLHYSRKSLKLKKITISVSVVSEEWRQMDKKIWDMDCRRGGEAATCKIYIPNFLKTRVNVEKVKKLFFSLYGLR